MSEANNLVPATEEELDNADSMLASLTDIAYSTATEDKPVVVKERRRSRFFFRLSPSFSEEVKNKQKAFSPKQLTHVDHQIEKRLKSYEKEIPSELEVNIGRVREFFLKEIAPISLAANAGSMQAMEVVKRLLGSNIDETQFEKFERMAAKAVEIRMARFICREFGMTKAEAKEILDTMMARPAQTIIPIGVPQHEHRQSRKETKKA